MSPADLLRTRPLYDAAAVRTLDAAAASAGIPGSTLMARAGRAVAAAVEAENHATRGRTTVLVLCGPGQNGGDGWVAADRLAARGLAVTLVYLRGPDELRGDARAAAEAVQPRPGLTLVAAPDDPGAIATMPEFEAEYEIIVDAVFGIGLTEAPDARAAALLDAAARIRARGARVLAVDVPSGLIADGGRVPGAALAADRVLTIGLDKFGLHVWPGAALVGQVDLLDIGYPVELVEAASPCAELLTGVAPALRAADAHKGSFGHVLVVGGSSAMPGAAALAARAALRGGAGRVTVASETEGLAGLDPEAMRRPLAARWCAVGREDLRAAIDDADVIVTGPGLGGEGAEAAAALLALAGDRPLVVDADLLRPECWRDAPTSSRRVITPHPGEAARLLGRTTAEIQADRVGAARSLAAHHGSVVVLKGAGTLVAAPDGRLAVSPWALPQLAAPGSGDVLAGLCGALLAQGWPAFEAAAGAVWLHGAAAEPLLPGLLAHEIADRLPTVLAAERGR